MISEGIPLGAVQVPPDGQPGAQVRLRPVVQEVAHRQQVECLQVFLKG